MLHSLLLKNIDGPRSQQGYRREGDKCLYHYHDLCPGRQNGSISGRKSRTGIERQKQVIDKTGTPVLFVHVFPGFAIQGHLRKQKGSVGMGAAPLTGVGSSRVEAPIPGREDENVRNP